MEEKAHGEGEENTVSQGCIQNVRWHSDLFTTQSSSKDAPVTAETPTCLKMLSYSHVSCFFNGVVTSY